jgi:hypothetical protein
VCLHICGHDLKRRNVCQRKHCGLGEQDQPKKATACGAWRKYMAMHKLCIISMSGVHHTTGLLGIDVSNLHTLQSNVTGRSTGDFNRQFRKALQVG